MRERILVTGHTGFVGRNLIPVLLQQKYDLILPNRDSFELTDYESVHKTLKQYNPDVIIHLAALAGGIGANRKRPFDFIAINQQMNLNIVNASIAHKVDKLLTLGSVCAYPKLAPTPFREDDIWQGKPEDTNLPYGQSKRDLMVLCETARYQYGLNAVHLIPTNLYGRYDNFDLETSHVIPALMKKLHLGRRSHREVTLWGSGSASRDFLHVLDLCEAIVLALKADNLTQPINIGSGEATTIKQLSVLMSDIVGFKGDIRWDKLKPDGQPNRQLDISRAKCKLDWQPKVPLKDGLKNLYEWWKNNND